MDSQTRPNIPPEPVSRPTAEDDTAQVSWFPVPEEHSLPQDIQEVFGELRGRLGFVPNNLRSYAFRPERLRAYLAHSRQLPVATPNLSNAEREMIAVAVSMANGCLYCLVSHGAALRKALKDPVLADRITLDYRKADLDDRLLAILDYAVKITTRPRECDQSDIYHLLQLGLSLEEVWDVIEIACMYNFTNRLAMATGQIPNAPYHFLHR